MANKRPRLEEIVTKLRQVEVLTGQGMPRLDAIRQIGAKEKWLGFLDTYRTMCVAPEPGFRKLLQDVHEFGAAA